MKIQTHSRLHGSDSAVALDELHISINRSIYFPGLQPPWWTTGQTEAVPCGDVGGATARRLPAHHCCLDRSASLNRKCKHICKHTQLLTAVKCHHHCFKVPHAAAGKIYWSGCVSHGQKQQWEKRKWVMSNIIWMWWDSVSPSLVMVAKGKQGPKERRGGELNTGR